MCGFICRFLTQWHSILLGLLTFYENGITQGNSLFRRYTVKYSKTNAHKLSASEAEWMQYFLGQRKDQGSNPGLAIFLE